MPSSFYVPIIVLVLLWGRSKANLIAPHQGKLDVNHKKPLQTFRPYNVAHRGSSDRIPEETTAAYLSAIEEEADFIDADIVASKDGHLECFHDVTLDATTNIANWTEFAYRN